VEIGPGHPAESRVNAANAKTRIQERESIPMNTAISRTRQSQSTQYRSRSAQSWELQASVSS
jgi:hypothetical protein